MVRVNLDLEKKNDLQVLGTTGWKIAMGLVPGEPNQGLVAEILGSPARLVDYDDSSWDHAARSSGSPGSKRRPVWPS